MSQACPLIFRNVDGTVIRVGTVFVALFVVLFLATSQVAILYFLAVDFMIRLYGLKKYSFIHQLSLFTKNALSLKEDISDAGAKRVAAQFGVSFIFMLIVESYFRVDILLYTTAGIFLSCSALEIVFNYCIGCKVYFIIKKIYPSFME